MPAQFEEGDALLIVDIQNDFMKGGTMGVPDADAIVPIINSWLAAARTAEVPVYASRLTYPFNHVSFEGQGGKVPPHCVQDTRGASFFPGIDLKEDIIILSRGDHPERDAISAFVGTDLANRLQKMEVKRLWVAGVPLDRNVEQTIGDALENGFEVLLLQDATRPLKRDAAGVVKEMEKRGVTLVSGAAPGA